MKAILVCVDFCDLLEVTLPYNRHHFDEVYVVTSNADDYTKQVARDNDAICIATDAFYEPAGVAFNKYRALNVALHKVDRHGWMCMIDADVMWPKEIDWDFIAGNLYTPLRRMHKDLSQPIPDELQWKSLPIHPQRAEWAGYSQIFHWDDPVIPNGDLFEEWSSCSGGDSHFQRRWAANKKIRPSWHCLHVGPDHVNWCGRTAKYLDGTTPEGSEENKEKLRDLLLQRRQKRSLKQEILRS